ncbi:hypothetical protein [Haloactinopolyspora sp.]|jgi:hypothetical protein|uniref:hypothetical protein n=1 Tax=Haloactinopolyspora sp. TaxID=1966353 RepID=UPI002613F529|nr:hypothetical protein [Haloactinopolyspora sp.]
MLYVHAGVYDPHAERCIQAEENRNAQTLIRARRLERWSRRAARVSARLSRHAGAWRARLV